MPATKDHRVPLSRGGSHFISNIVATCLRCNSSKGARTEEHQLHRFSEASTPTASRVITALVREGKLATIEESFAQLIRELHRKPILPVTQQIRDRRTVLLAEIEARLTAEYDTKRKKSVASALVVNEPQTMAVSGGIAIDTHRKA